MAKDARQRQKKLQKRKAKEKAKKKALANQNPRDIALRIQRAATAPILHCLTTNVLWEEGISNVLVSRKLTSGNVAFVAFLLDVYCLGVKNVMFDIVSRSVYEWKILDKLLRDYEQVDLSPEAARKLIEGAVEYARGLGLPPHSDYRKAKQIFGDINASACHDEFEYGKDGKPFFIGGPNDSPARCSQIVNTLTAHCGEDGFHYQFAIGGSSALAGGPSILALDDAGEVDDGWFD